MPRRVGSWPTRTGCSRFRRTGGELRGARPPLLLRPGGPGRSALEGVAEGEEEIQVDDLVDGDRGEGRSVAVAVGEADHAVGHVHLTEVAPVHRPLPVRDPGAAEADRAEPQGLAPLQGVGGPWICAWAMLCWMCGPQVPSWMNGAPFTWDLMPARSRWPGMSRS